MRIYNKRHKRTGCFRMEIILLIIFVQFICMIFVQKPTQAYTWDEWLEQVKIITGNINLEPSKQQCKSENFQQVDKCGTKCNTGIAGSNWVSCCGCPGLPPCKSLKECLKGECLGSGRRGFSNCTVVKHDEGKSADIKHEPSVLHAGCQTHAFECIHCGHLYWHHIHVAPLDPVSNPLFTLLDAKIIPNPCTSGFDITLKATTTGHCESVKVTFEKNVINGEISLNKKLTSNGKQDWEKVVTIPVETNDGKYKVTFTGYIDVTGISVSSKYHYLQSKTIELAVNSGRNADGYVISLDKIQEMLKAKGVNKEKSQIRLEDVFSKFESSELDAMIKTTETPVIPADEKMIVLAKVYTPQYQKLDTDCKCVITSQYDGFDVVMSENKVSYFASMVQNNISIPEGKQHIEQYIHFIGQFRIKNSSTFLKSIITTPKPYILKASSPPPPPPPSPFYSEPLIGSVEGECTLTPVDGSNLRAGYGVGVSATLKVNVIPSAEYVYSYHTKLVGSVVKLYIIENTKLQSIVGSGDFTKEHIPLLRKEECMKLIKSQKDVVDDETNQIKKVLELEPAHGIELERDDGGNLYVQERDGEFKFQLKENNEYSPYGKRQIYTDPATPDGTYLIVIEADLAVDLNYYLPQEGEMSAQVISENKNIVQVLPIKLVIKDSMYNADATMHQP